MLLDIDRIRAERPANHIHFFESVGSTMTEAANLAEAEAPHATVVLAEEQTAGIGRFGRTWHSPAGSRNLLLDCAALELPPGSVPIASLLVGLAAADAIQKTTNLLCDLRWPNDVLIGERKVAGILTHLNRRLCHCRHWDQRESVGISAAICEHPRLRCAWNRTGGPNRASN